MSGQHRRPRASTVSRVVTLGALAASGVALSAGGAQAAEPAADQAPASTAPTVANKAPYVPVTIPVVVDTPIGLAKTGPKQIPAPGSTTSPQADAPVLAMGDMKMPEGQQPEQPQPPVEEAPAPQPLPEPQPQDPTAPPEDPSFPAPSAPTGGVLGGLTQMQKAGAVEAPSGATTKGSGGVLSGLPLLGGK